MEALTGQMVFLGMREEDAPEIILDTTVHPEAVGSCRGRRNAGLRGAGQALCEGGSSLRAPHDPGPRNPGAANRYRGAGHWRSRVSSRWRVR